MKAYHQQAAMPSLCNTGLQPTSQTTQKITNKPNDQHAKRRRKTATATGCYCNAQAAAKLLSSEYTKRISMDPGEE
jgi:glutamate dehydrogenase/leucine dehydrogenase